MFTSQVWLHSVVVTALDSQSTDLRFSYHPLHCWLCRWASSSYACASITKQHNLVLVKGRWCSKAGQIIVITLVMSHRLCGLYCLCAKKAKDMQSGTLFLPTIDTFVILSVKILKAKPYRVRTEHLVVFRDIPEPILCIFQDFPGPHNRVDIEQVKLSHIFTN